MGVALIVLFGVFMVWASAEPAIGVFAAENPFLDVGNFFRSELVGADAEEVESTEDEES